MTQARSISEQRSDAAQTQAVWQWRQACNERAANHTTGTRATSWQTEGERA